MPTTRNQRSPREPEPSAEKKDATGLKGRCPSSTRGHHDVPNSPSSERPSVGCASAEPTSICAEVYYTTRSQRMSPSHDLRQFFIARTINLPSPSSKNL